MIERPRLGGGAWWRPARHARWHQGWIARVEPSTCSYGPFSIRSSPTQSTEDGDSHRGPCHHQRCQAKAGDEKADTRTVGEVVESLWCTSGFGSSSGGDGGVSSSSATSRARSGCNEMVRRRRFLAAEGKEMARVNRGRFIGVSNYVRHQGFGFQPLILASIFMTRIEINFISFPL
jgi:hypothetical protein